MFRSFIILTITLSLYLFCFPVGARAVSDLPFYPGERLTFKLKWTFIPAGEAVLEVLPAEVIHNVKVYHFLLTARTNSFIDNFYKVRDRIDAYADIEMTRSIMYKKQQREGTTRRDVTVDFNWEKNEVVYAALKDKKAPVKLMPGSFDPLSAFYYIRFFDFKENTAIERPVTDGKKCVMGKAFVIKKETIKIGKETYISFLIEPELKNVGGVFEKSKNAKIKLWVTADKKHIPVKIKSKVVVGSFVGELVSYTPGIKREALSPEP